MQDLMAGQLDAALVPYPIVRTDVLAGRLRLLGTTEPRLLPELEKAPPIKLEFPDLGAARLGLFAPLATPKSVLEVLQNAVRKSVGSTSYQSAMRTLGVQAEFGDSASFARWMEAQRGITPYACKKKDTCDADRQCPRPCPQS